MKAYRLGKTKFIHDLSGKGSFLFGGRWNKKGFPALYLTSSRSLAILENLVHIADEPGKGEYSLLTLTIPSNASVLNFTQLGVSKKEVRILYDGQETTEEIVRELGTKWLSSQKSLLLKIPSAVVFEEHNFLLNPLHPDFLKITISGARLFHFDRRLFFQKSL